MEKRKSFLPILLIYFFLTLACVIFSILCLYTAKKPFIHENALLFSALSGTAFFLLFAIFFYFVYKEKIAAFKTLLSVQIFILIALVFCFILQKTGFFAIIASESALQEFLQSAGIWMPLIYILLQFLQVVILPIPSIVSTLAGVALFGPLYTTIYSLIGIILGSLTAFLIGRKLGYKAVVWMIGEETLTKWQSKLKGKDSVFLTLMFLLPFFPDDVLCFLAGLSSMSISYFVGLIFISRILAVGTTCFSIDLIPFNTWWGLLIWGILLVGIVIVFYLVYRNLDRIQAIFKRIFSKRKRRGK